MSKTYTQIKDTLDAISHNQKEFEDNNFCSGEEMKKVLIIMR